MRKKIVFSGVIFSFLTILNVMATDLVEGLSNSLETRDFSYENEFSSNESADFSNSRARCNKCRNHYDYDYIIIGNGTAGAVLARKLSDNFKNRVLVLEAGVNNDQDPIVLNPNNLAVWQEISYDPQYAVAYPYPLFNPYDAYAYTEGRGWGGGSMHNYMIAVRGTPAIYDAWAASSSDWRWAYQNVLPLMKALENYTPNGTVIDLAQRGVGGPISITQLPPVDTDPFAIATATATNVPFVADYNDPTEGVLGISAGQYFITPGANSRRSFASLDFLGNVVSAEGKGLQGRKLDILSNAYVSRVLFKKNKAIGVEFISSNSQEEIIKVYGKKIILCAGAINSPAILQRSGIGDSALLDSLGIDVLVNNPNVGANLQNQYGSSGVITGAVTQSFGGFLDPYNLGVRRTQLLAASIPSVGAKMLGFILEPNSRGSVKIVSKNPLIQPLVDLNLYGDGSYTIPGTDANLAIAFLYQLKAIAALSGGVVISPPPTHFPAPYGPAPDASLLFNDIKTLSNLVIANHIVGTTRMSSSIQNGVVDGKLRVFGVKNLMVVDNGICPISPDGNPCYSAYVIGLTAATILGVPVPPAL